MQLIQPSYHIYTPIDSDDILQSLEIAGRTAWKSEDKITKDSAPKFVKMLLGKNHESVIEHINLTVKFIVSRSFLAEITRHRISSFTVESSRYCAYNKEKRGMTFIIPTYLDILPGEYTYSIHRNLGFGQTKLYHRNHEIYEINTNENRDFLDYLFSVEDYYNKLIKEGKKPQEARCILPNCLKTEIVMTTNLREWKHIFRLRIDKSAHPEMQQIMRPLLEELKRKVSVIFDDITYD